MQIRLYHDPEGTLCVSSRLALLYSLSLRTVSIVVRHLFVEVAVRSVLGAARLHAVEDRGWNHVEVSGGLRDAVKALLAYPDGTKIYGQLPEFLPTYPFFGIGAMMLPEERI